MAHDACKIQYCIIRNTESIQIWLKGQNLGVAAPPSSYYLAHKPALQVHMNVSTKFAIKSCVSIWASSLITIVFAVPLRNCFVNVRVQIQLTSMLQQCKHCAVSRLVTTPWYILALSLEFFEMLQTGYTVVQTMIIVYKDYKCFSIGMFIIDFTVNLDDKSFILQFPFERFQLKEASLWRRKWEIFPCWDKSTRYWGFTPLCVPLECRNKEKTNYRVCPSVSMVQQVYACMITQVLVLNSRTQSHSWNLEH